MNRDVYSISVNDVIDTLRDFVRSKQPASLLAFASELTGLSVDALLDEIYQDQAIDFDKIVFLNFDDDGLPVEFFFDYDVDEQQKETFVSGLGYRTDICEKVSFCLSLASLDDFVFEALLTFDDGEVRREEVDCERDVIGKLIGVMEKASTKEALEALKAFDSFVDDNLGEFCEGSDRSINRERLQQYLEDEMILEFSSPEECMEYFNTYDYQHFRTVAEMKRYQGMFGFGLDGKWYHISYREALSVWEPLGFADKLENAIRESKAVPCEKACTAGEKAR